MVAKLAPLRGRHLVGEFSLVRDPGSVSERGD